MTQAPVLVVVDHADGAPSQPAAELLTAARTIGAGAPFAALWLAAEEPSGQARARLGELGAATVYLPRLDGLDARLTAVAVDAVVAAVGAAQPQAVLLTSSLAGKELAAGLAVRLGSGAVVDANRLARREDGTLAAGKAVFDASWDTECAVVGEPAIIALEPGAFVAELPAQVADAEPVAVAVDFGQRARAVRVLERTEHRTGEAPLNEASVVVVGGRGTEGDFSLVDELAALLGGAVGATRDVTDEGWRDHSAQIGQTGVTVAPRLYIGAGVSGAVHHTVGMRASQTIVAVNTDPDAPIFEIADFGVVGALEDVLPQAVAALREHLAQLA